MPVDPAARRTGPGRGTPSIAVSDPLVTDVRIPLSAAALAWLVGWLAGNILGSAVLSISGHANTDAVDRPVWLTVSMALALWAPQLGALYVVSKRFGSGNPTRDLGLRFRPIDLLGIPIGIASQVLLLRALYWPLKTVWPGTFADKRLEQNARDLYDSASGAWIVVLVLAIVVVAPFVEELVYRGLLQGAMRREVPDIVAVVVVAAFFALIHFRAIEYPGLFAFGLVLGTCAWLTDRLGMGIAAHVAFNATAVVLVAR
ncbi:MAG TPA: CPBP family intramembrane glutamic endopeptidase [Ilumatobacteraceae bacterium]|nr:CPBP family intramembrane glutamic endopeptidase [Ilumatobacteraceae bacterium]